MSPARLRQFVEAYAAAVIDVAHELGTDLGGQSPEEYAADTAILMGQQIERGGVEAVLHYRLNARGALAGACLTLGFAYSPHLLTAFLEGK